jgi:hypothetical protein
MGALEPVERKPVWRRVAERLHHRQRSIHEMVLARHEVDFDRDLPGDRPQRKHRLDRAHAAARHDHPRTGSRRAYDAGAGGGDRPGAPRCAGAVGGLRLSWRSRIWAPRACRSRSCAGAARRDRRSRRTDGRGRRHPDTRRGRRARRVRQEGRAGAAAFMAAAGAPGRPAAPVGADVRDPTVEPIEGAARALSRRCSICRACSTTRMTVTGSEIRLCVNADRARLDRVLAGRL